MRTSATPASNGTGNPTVPSRILPGTCTIAEGGERPIPETRSSEDARHEFLGSLAAIVESSEDAIFRKSLDGVIESWNAGAVSMYGYRPEEIIGRPVSTLAPSDRKDEITAILEQITRGERVEHFATKRVTKEGRTIDVSLSISPVRDDTGRIVGAATNLAILVAKVKP